MKTSELRIGNLVYKANVLHVIKSGAEIDMAHMFTPVELSSDLLYASGWIDYGKPECCIGNWKFSFEQGYFWIWDYPDPESSIKMKVPFVHHLQNICFDITGEELQIEKPL